MGKSLKFKNNISLDQINFLGFANSPNWVGFYDTPDSDTKHDLASIEQSSSMIKNYFARDWEDFFLLCAVCYKEEEDIQESDYDDQVIDRYGHIYNAAKESGLLQPYTEDYERYQLDDHPLPAHLLRLCFDSDLILPMTEMVMAMLYYRISGQACFLINPKLKVALYPHDETGYGCISLQEDKSILIDFLKYCEQQGFEIHID